MISLIEESPRPKLFASCRLVKADPDPYLLPFCLSSQHLKFRCFQFHRKGYYTVQGRVPGV